MKPETINSIIKLNNDFYKTIGTDFSRTREYPWVGWGKLLPIMKRNIGNSTISVLDIACGNGRFFEFLYKNHLDIKNSLGVDSSNSLLEIARHKIGNERILFKNQDLIRNPVDTDSRYDLIVSFGFMHHIPSSVLRNQKILEYFQLLSPKGLLILTFWMHGINKEKIINKDMTDGTKQFVHDFEPGDCIMGWSNASKIERYVHLFSKTEIQNIENMFDRNQLVTKYYSDGKTGKDNCYIVIRKNS